MDKNKKNADKKNIITRVVSQGIFPYQFAFTLLIPLRNIFISPKKLIKRLDLEENYNVLEVGPGPGYFSIKVAPVISKGKLIISDIQQEMLDYTKKRLEKKNIFNVDYHLSNGQDFPFESESLDRIFMVTVLGEVENKNEYIFEFYRMLKSGGILSISEQAGDADKMNVDEIKDLFEGTGFKFDKLFGSENNFTINFKKE